MCGSPVSGPLLVLFFPFIVVAQTLDTFSRLDTRIRANNERLGNRWHQKRQDWKNRLLFRKQIKAESKLNEQLKKFQNKNTEWLENESEREVSAVDPSDQEESTNEEAQADAILFVQRAVVRSSATEFEKALKDLAFAQELDPSLKDTYIVLYLEGFCYSALGQYFDAAHSFKRAIQLKENMTSDCVEKCLELERKIFEIQTEMKHKYEKALQSIGEVAESTRQYLHNSKEYLKNKWFRRGSKSQSVNSSESVTQVEPPITTSAPPCESDTSHQHSLIALEELYFRAAIAYYYSAYYSDSVTYYTKAIEMVLPNEDKTLLASCYYNRGLSHYYSNALDHALEDFLNCTKLQQNIDALKMIAATYGRKGCPKEQSEYKKQAKLMNPLTTFVSVFHYRLLDENSTHLVFSFLPIHSLMLVGGTCRYWRELATQNVVQRPYLEISYNNLINNVQKQVEKANQSSLKEKLFLPSPAYKTNDDLLGIVLSASFFDLYDQQENKTVVLKEYPSWPYFYNSPPCEGSRCNRFLKSISTLYVRYDLILSSSVLDEVLNHSPRLKELVIFDDRDETSIYDLDSLDFSKFLRLKKIILYVNYRAEEYSTQSSSPIPKFPECVECVEYLVTSKEALQHVFEKYPNIKFQEIKEDYSYLKDSTSV
ncbi:hypothetical protein C9374_011142 [Naegleria lovaniensis]|uniref:DENND3-like TPR repeats domain-containing protein n=1 Tax=Naegleria lovaniensis TaxID=51637 RepID=A0AA88GF62_NAELO|nr:uncharacterized protein C9374_011142 [Naegleria lovaniensis]KAG2374063.1 hypothetical protein C9374_011142 [Naegleria lovaniensis]